ncbi:hypothetical protein ANN_22372 [Periplaneta americana]|uniref:HTH CENPB-type domain-containing protein n=1 Tax=Periplaneta americana TaxID=6978 RepID=A0ABQ8S8Y0_PERAM|nr:hypothetical protein ANN_22372 [Periplaneta americana]
MSDEKYYMIVSVLISNTVQRNKKEGQVGWSSDTNSTTNRLEIFTESAEKDPIRTSDIASYKMTMPKSNVVTCMEMSQRCRDQCFILWLVFSNESPTFHTSGKHLEVLLVITQLVRGHTRVVHHYIRHMHVNNHERIREMVIRYEGYKNDSRLETYLRGVSYSLKINPAEVLQLTRRSVMQLAYEIAEKNKLATRLNKETESAGKEWFSGFMKRHPELSLRQPEATSLARASGFNRVVVGKFFDTLEQLVDQHKLTAARIFNMDETSHTVVQRQEKILAQRGKHQVGAISSCERGQNVTGVYAMSASGFFVPPILIYARKEMMESLTFGAPRNTIFRCQDKGWMDSDTFCE